MAPSNAESLAKAGLQYEKIQKNLNDFHIYLSPFNSLKFIKSEDENYKKNTENIWIPYLNLTKITKIDNPEKYGKFISLSETAKLQDLLIEILRTKILPDIEEKLKVLSMKLIPKKVGFFGKEVLNETPSLNFDLRRYADLSFLFQDYFNSFNTYEKLFERIKKVFLLSKNNRKELSLQN